MVRCYFKNSVKLVLFITFLYATFCYLTSLNQYPRPSGKLGILAERYGFHLELNSKEMPDPSLLVNKLKEINLQSTDSSLVKWKLSMKSTGANNDIEKDLNGNTFPFIPGIQILPGQGLQSDDLVIGENDTPAVAEEKYYRYCQ